MLWNWRKRKNYRLLSKTLFVFFCIITLLCIRCKLPIFIHTNNIFENREFRSFIKVLAISLKVSKLKLLLVFYQFDFVILVLLVDLISARLILSAEFSILLNHNNKRYFLVEFSFRVLSLTVMKLKKNGTIWNVHLLRFFFVCTWFLAPRADESFVINEINALVVYRTKSFVFFFHKFCAGVVYKRKKTFVIIYIVNWANFRVVDKSQRTRLNLLQANANKFSLVKRNKHKMCPTNNNNNNCWYVFTRKT